MIALTNMSMQIVSFTTSGSCFSAVNSTACSPVGAVGEGNLGSDVGNVDYSALCGVLCSIHSELVGNLDFIRNVFTADFVLAEAECATFLRGRWALAPADRADASGLVVAGWVA